MPRHGTLRRVAQWMAWGAVIVVVVAALLIAALRLLIANGMRIEGPAAIQESGYVTIGGQPQWIELRGWDRANPVLLWVHGGPGAGLTYAASRAQRRLTIDTMVNDGIQVAEYVHSRLPKVAVVLVGHSWGSVLATRMVQRRPDLFAAYVGTGQFTTLEDDGRDLFVAALARARRDSNDTAIRAPHRPCATSRC